jgi:hypothetical protein
LPFRVQEVPGDVRGATAEAARLLLHANLLLQLPHGVAEHQRPVPLELHDRLVGAEPGERVALQQRLGVRVGLRCGILADGVEKGRRGEQRAPPGVPRVGRVAVERVVVTVAVREVPDAVTAHLVVVRGALARLRDAEPAP